LRREVEAVGRHDRIRIDLDVFAGSRGTVLAQDRALRLDEPAQVHLTCRRVGETEPELEARQGFGFCYPDDRRNASLKPAARCN